MADCADSRTLLLDYSPSTLNMSGLRVGYSYSDHIEFFDETGAAEDITADTFRMVIKNAAGTTVATLVLTGGLLVGGLEIEGDNRLNYLIKAPVTAAAGIYTHELILVDPTTGSEFPIAVGQIRVV
jgi:hypothetical protein